MVFDDLSNSMFYCSDLIITYSWVSLYNYAVNLSGVNLGCTDAYAVVE